MTSLWLGNVGKCVGEKSVDEKSVGERFVGEKSVGDCLLSLFGLLLYL